MSGTILLVNPEAPAPDKTAIINERVIKRSGIRLGTLDNAKSNADHLLRFIVEGVRNAMPVASVVSLCKPNSSTPASSQVLERLAQETDCVVSAMGD
jgi:hypothetical protein